MRVAYVLAAPIGPTSSVGQKIERTLRVWDELGVEHRLFVLAREESATGWSVPTTAVAMPFASAHGELQRQLGAPALAGRVLEWDPDVVYSRILLYTPGLERLHHRVPLVHEVNSDDVVEFPSYASRLGRLHPKTRHLTLRHVNGFVFVTSELMNSPHFARYHRVPATVIANGIDVATTPRYAPPGNPRPRVVFLVGTTSPWTGVDKFVLLSRLLPEFDFDLVGSTGPLRDLPDNVTAHGYRTGSELEAILAKAEVGVSTLALHRKSMDEACTLKVRDCVARGIPMILAHYDTDFADPSPQLLSIPNSEHNVEESVDRIRRFVLDQRGQRVRDDVIERLDLRPKETTRMAFMEQVVAGRRASG